MSWTPPRVWNRRFHGDTIPGGAVYVGRPSPWGNPFPLSNESERANVLARYEAWLRTQPDLIARARVELRGRDLVCWCSPKACHADVLVRVANEGSPGGIAFTGTRQGMTDEQGGRFLALLERARARLGPCILHHGDCIGSDDDADMLAASIGLVRHIRPSTVAGTRAHTERRGALVVAPEAEPWMRDQWTVDAGWFLVATPKTFKVEERSGTWMTVRMARKAGKTAYVIWPDGSCPSAGASWSG